MHMNEEGGIVSTLEDIFLCAEAHDNPFTQQQKTNLEDQVSIFFKSENIDLSVVQKLY